MTIEKMRDALAEHCENTPNCTACPLNSEEAQACFDRRFVTDEELTKNYNIVFGKKSDHDNVNHPAHYETGKFECIDVMIETQGALAVQSYCVCAAFKYLYRHMRKNQIEDIKKARWYLDKFIELVEAADG